MTDGDLVEVFGSLNHPDIAHFGLILTALEDVEISGINPWNVCKHRNVYVKCLLETFLPCDAIEEVKKMMDKEGPSGAISAGAFSTAWSAYTAAERKIILKGIMQLASKYGGALAVVSMAIDFSWCLINNNGSYVGDPTTSFVAISEPSNLLPTPLPAFNYYVTTVQDAISYGMFPAWGTSIFFNSNDSKYYSDSIFINLVPDGYYVSSDMITNPNFHHIVGGIAIGVYTVQ